MVLLRYQSNAPEYRKVGSLDYLKVGDIMTRIYGFSGVLELLRDSEHYDTLYWPRIAWKKTRPQSSEMSRRVKTGYMDQAPKSECG